MKISNLSFITPLQNSKKTILEKDYSANLTLSDGSSLNLASKIGIRENQEDCLVVAENHGYLLLLVADGMGGLQSGEVASYNTAKIIKKWIETEDYESFQYIDEKNLKYVLNGLISLIMEYLPENSGTTLTMSIIGPKTTWIANIGDSRTYTIKDSEMTLRTYDDSLSFKSFYPSTKEQRDRLRFYKKNHVITNAISTKGLPQVEITVVQNDDYDILCHMSDGVSDILSEDTIKWCCQKENPASLLTDMAVSSDLVYNPESSPMFLEYIYPKDNATAIVYTKKRIKE